MAKESKRRMMLKSHQWLSVKYNIQLHAIDCERVTEWREEEEEVEEVAVIKLTVFLSFSSFIRDGRE